LALNLAGGRKMGDFILGFDSPLRLLLFARVLRSDYVRVCACKPIFKVTLSPAFSIAASEIRKQHFVAKELIVPVGARRQEKTFKYSLSATARVSGGRGETSFFLCSTPFLNAK
jgi:hypothetical protein